MSSSFTLTQSTLDILNNFAEIHEQVTLRPGLEQRTCNGIRSFIADVTLDAEIPQQCAIYDLNRILGVIKTVKNLPTLEFSEQALTVVHDYGRVTIPYAHPELVTKVPQHKFFVQDQFASFDLPATLWNTIKNQARVLDCNSLQIIINEHGDFTLRLVNDKDKAADAFASAVFNAPNTTVAANEPNTWAVNFDVLKFLPGNYKVEVGNLASKASGGTLFGAIFTLDDPNKKVTYLTSGTVVKSR